MNQTHTRTGAGARRGALPLLSLVSGLLLAACGPTADTTAPTPAPAGTPTTVALATGTTGGATAVGGGTATTGTAITPTIASSFPADKKYVIGILQTSTHPALDFTREGIKQAFIQAGLVEGKTVTFDVRNEELDAPTAAKMADAFIAAKVDAIMTIGTPATAAALAQSAKQKSAIPIFFSAVADPFGPGFAGKKEGDTVTADLRLHPENLTGAQAFPPVEDGLKLVQQVKPGVKTVGLLWNPGEPNSKATTDKAREVAGKLGLTIIDRPAPKPADTLNAASALADSGVDVFFVSTTNSVVAGLDSVVRVSQERGIPLFGNDPLSASRGAVAALGLDYTENGMQAGGMAVQVLTGKATIKTMDVQQTTKQGLCVNTKAADLQKVTLPAALLTQAKACTYNEIKVPLPPAPSAATPGAGTPAPAATATKAP